MLFLFSQLDGCIIINNIRNLLTSLQNVWWQTLCLLMHIAPNSFQNVVLSVSELALWKSLTLFVTIWTNTKWGVNLNQKVAIMIAHFESQKMTNIFFTFLKFKMAHSVCGNRQKIRNIFTTYKAEKKRGQKARKNHPWLILTLFWIGIGRESHVYDQDLYDHHWYNLHLGRSTVL